jgi:hypothetical protein
MPDLAFPRQPGDGIDLDWDHALDPALGKPPTVFGKLCYVLRAKATMWFVDGPPTHHRLGGQAGPARRAPGVRRPRARHGSGRVRPLRARAQPPGDQMCFTLTLTDESLRRPATT